MNVAVSGLKYAVAVDFHFRSNSLYWTDSSQRAIMNSTLDGAKLNIVLDHGLSQPGIVHTFSSIHVSRDGHAKTRILAGSDT